LAFLFITRKMSGMSASKQTSTGTAMAPLQLERKRLLLILGLGLLTSLALLALFGGRAALDALAHANWPLVAAAVAVHYSGFAVRGHRWQALLAMTGHRLGCFYTTAVLLAGWFVSALLPARTGDLLRVGILRLDRDRHTPVPVADSLSSIVLERVLDILAILLLGAVFGFAFLRHQAPGWLLASYAAGIALLVAFGALLLLVPAVIGWLRRLTGHALWQKTLDFARRLVDGLRALFSRPRVAALVVTESLYIWLCDAVVLWLVLLSLHAAVPLAAAAFVALTVDVLAAIPLTPGGVGQIDAAYAALLAMLPLPPFNVGAVVLVVRLISYWSFIAFSGIVTVAAGFGSMLHAAPTQQMRDPIQPRHEKQG